jgi:hypothetical protein
MDYVYDTESFLAGVAVGRNMESWPAMQGISVFKFTVQVSAGLFQGPWVVFDGTISWGDGRSDDFDNIPANYTENESYRNQISHSYAAAGTYQIEMVGRLLDWSTTRSSAILSGNSYLISIDTPFPRSMEHKTYLTACCYYSSALVKLPAKPFRHLHQLQRIYRFCYRCSSLQALPPRLFEGCKSLTDVRQAFMNCDIRSVPADLFAGSPAIETAAGVMSYNSHLTEIPAGLLDPLQNLKTAPGFNSLGITTLPEYLFVNCPDIDTFDNLCYSSTSFREIPADLFSYNPGATSFQGAFGRTAIEEIPADLFDDCPLASNFRQCFADCTSLTGAVPELWVQFPAADGTECFRGCTGAANYADIPDEWK